MIFEAGPITLLRTILIIVLVYYAAKFLFKILFPILVKKFMRKQQEKFHQTQSDHSTQHNKSTKEKKKSDNKDTLGEYVDYEEVEEWSFLNGPIILTKFPLRISYGLIQYSKDLIIKRSLFLFFK